MRQVSAIPQPDPPAGAVRMNDGKCDPAGRFWAGSMAYDARPGAGSLYRLDPDGQVHEILRGLTISNGLAWTPDGATMLLHRYADPAGGHLRHGSDDRRHLATAGR